MSVITRGVVATVLLAGAVAGAAAFPHFLAGPGGSQTAHVTPLPAATKPAIVHARALPEPGHIVALPVIVPAAIARVSVVRVAPPPTRLTPVVIHRVTPSPRVAPEPTPAPAGTSAAAVIPIAAAAAPAPPTPAPAPVQPPPSHDNGNGKDHAKKQERVVAAVQPLPSTSNGPPAQQTPPGTASGDSGAVGPVETTDAQAAPSDHGHGPPPWANGGGKGK